MSIVKYDELVRKLELKTIASDIFDDKTVEFDKEFIEEVVKAMKEMRSKAITVNQTAKEIHNISHVDEFYA